MFTLIVTIAVVLVAFLKTVARGGDWFDLLQSNARYENQRTNFEFGAMFAIMCAVLIGGAAYLIFMSLQNDEFKPVFITDLDPSANVTANHPTKAHTAPAHTATAKRHHK